MRREEGRGIRSIKKPTSPLTYQPPSKPCPSLTMVSPSVKGGKWPTCMIFQLFLLFSVVKTFKRNISQEPNADSNLKHASPPGGGRRSPFGSTAPGCEGEQPVPSVLSKPWACGRQGHREGQANGISEACRRLTVGSQGPSLCPEDQGSSPWSRIQELARNFFYLLFYFDF